MTLAKRLITLISCDDQGRLIHRIQRGGLDVEYIEAVAAMDYAEGADEIWIQIVPPSYKGVAAIYDTLKNLTERLFVPIVAWSPILSLADARIAVSLGADKVVVDVHRSMLETNQDPLGYCSSIAETIGVDRTIAALHFRRVIHAKGTFFELVDPLGKPTGLDALQLALELPRFGAGELCLIPTSRAGVDTSKTIHDAEMLERVLELTHVPVISMAHDKSIADVLLPLMIGAHGVVLTSIIRDYQISLPLLREGLSSQTIRTV